MKAGIETEAARPARPLVKAIVHVLYFLAVTAFFVWCRLPDTVVKEASERVLRQQIPQFAWRVASVSVQFPLKVVLAGVEASLPGGQAPPVLVIEQLAVTPGVKALLGGNFVFAYSASLWQGRVTGTVSLPDRSTSIVEMDGAISDLLLASGSRSLTLLGRDVRGKVSGHFRYHGRADTVRGEGEAALALADGGVGLTEPLFGLKQIDVDQSHFDMVLHGGEVTVTKGSFRNKDLRGEISGAVSLSTSLPASRLQLAGWCELFPSFFVNLHLGGGVEEFLRQRGKEGRVPFALHGAVMAPQFTLK